MQLTTEYLDTVARKMCSQRLTESHFDDALPLI
jgi:hypothetical protein